MRTENLYDQITMGLSSVAMMLQDLDQNPGLEADIAPIRIVLDAVKGSLQTLALAIEKKFGPIALELDDESNAVWFLQPIIDVTTGTKE